MEGLERCVDSEAGGHGRELAEHLGGVGGGGGRRGNLGGRAVRI